MISPVNPQHSPAAPTRTEKDLQAIACIQRWLSIFTAAHADTTPSAVVEIRAIGCTAKYKPRPHTIGGFFDLDHLREAAEAAFDLQLSNARGIYFTLNPVKPDLLSRRANRVEAISEADSISAADSDILRRHWILIDADPVRTSGVSSSEAEKAAALATIQRVRDDLALSDWPEPIKADSGNGYHLIYRVDLPNDEASTALVRNCLRALAAKFDSEAVKIDTVVYNAARICKLYGTISRKGDHTPERPHRFARIRKEDIPQEIKAVPRELLEELAATAPAEKTAGKSSNGSKPRSSSQGRGRGGNRNSDPIKAAAAYLAKVPPAISGQWGHKKIYHAACILIDGFALSTEDARPILLNWNETCQPSFSQADVERKLLEAEKNCERTGNLLKDSIRENLPRSITSVADLQMVWGGEPDEKSPDAAIGESSTTPELITVSPPPPSLICNGVESEAGIIPASMDFICQSISKATNGWPKRVGGSLFIHDGISPEVDWLDKTAALFGWIGHATSQPPIFHRDPACHSREEVYAALTRVAEAFEAVESLPHEPPVPGHYYTYPTPRPGNGDALAGLIDRFNPETPIDRDLIVAMFATVLWGGGGGCRPAFVITSDRGRGSGKSTLASMLSQFAGGSLEISANEDAKSMKERLLSPDGLRKRVAILDNVKTLRFSWAELEALITSSVISGRRMYAGEGSRPNNLTWIITLNGIALSTDMAQRVVVIKINRPEHSGNWEDETRDYLRKYRHEIIADLIDVLRQPTIELSQYTRWGKWEKDVLSRLPDPNEAQRVIAERQAQGNVEADESELLEEYIAEQLESLGYVASEVQVMIPSAVLHMWFNAATGEKRSTIDVGRIVSQKIAEKAVQRLTKYRYKKFKCVLWVGEEANPERQPHFDVEERIDQKKREDRRNF